MRVSDRATARNYLKYLNKAKTDYAKTQQQIISTHRFESMSEDVSAGTRVMRTRLDMYKAEKHLDNVKSVNEELATAEDTMKTVGNILKQVHGLLVHATNDGTGEAGRLADANVLKSLREQVLSLANTQYGKRYTFGGSNSSVTPPFALGADGRLEYNGVSTDSIQKDANGYFYMDGADRKEIPMDGDVYMDVGLGIRVKGSQVEADTGFLISYSGLDIMGFGTNADGKTNNIYNLLMDAEKSIRDGVEKDIGAWNDQLSVLTDGFNANLTNIGGKTDFLDIMQGRLESNVDSHKIRINNLMGTNMEEASTTQTMNDFVLKSVLQMGSKILPTSLMDFLR